MNACFTWKFMTRYATYFFIATPCCLSRSSSSPLTSRTKRKMANEFSTFRWTLEGKYISSRFFFPFRTLLSSIDKNKFRTRDILSDRWWFTIYNKNSLDSRCSFSFFLSRERERERGDSVMLAFLLETISYRVSRAKLSCCSTRSSLPFSVAYS